MPIRVRLLVLMAAIAALALCPVAAARAATAGASTPVTANPAQVAQFLFVAGDVGRLSTIPSGTESLVLEKVLQELYTESPATPPSQAVSDIQTLQGVLSSGSAAVSPSTLTVMAGNQRVLAILRALTDAGAPADLQHPLAQVTERALADSAQAEQVPGQSLSTTFDATDAGSNLQFGTFSAARTLADTAALASTDKAFGQARDMLWQNASHESVFDGTQTLLSENPALQNDPIKSFVALLASDGSLSSNVGSLEQRVNDGVSQIGDQNCALAPGKTGASPADCASGALHDAQVVSQACPAGGSTAGACQDARNQAQSDAAGELAAISAQQAATSAEATALGDASSSLQQAALAEAQAAAQIADQEQQYLDFQNFNQGVKAGTDTVALVLSLTAAEVDPAAAINGLLTVFGDVFGWQFGGPDPNTLILQGIQGLSQQLSDFSQYTQQAFSAIDSRLSSLSLQVAQDEYALSSQLSVAQSQITGLSGQLTSLQGSVDQLQSEVQTLFSQSDYNRLFTVISQNIGFAAKNNGAMLDQHSFSDAANELYSDATGTAYTTVLNPLKPFDALSANSQFAGAASLGSNINYFNAFNPADAPSYLTWTGSLTPAAQCHNGLAACLPNPDYWATAARAYAQLLLENPRWVTQTYLGYLTQIEDEGKQISDAMHQLSVNDAGSDTSGTGNKLFDAAVTYYEYWGNQYAHAPGAAPNLAQAIHNEEQAYLATQNKEPGLMTIGDSGVDPWGGVNQSPDIAHLQLSSSFTNVQPCPGLLPAGTDLQAYALPSLPAGLISALPAPVLNAVRLGIGSISACWTAVFDNPSVGGDGRIYGQLDTTIGFTYTDPNGTKTFIGQSGSGSTVADCTPDGTSNPEREGADNVIRGWPGVPNRDTTCDDVSSLWANPLNQHTSYPSSVKAVIEPVITNELARLQKGIYDDLTRGGSQLTSGMSGGLDTDVEAAAERLNGATALLNGYVSLGFPQSLATDDALHSLVLGQGRDAFAPADPTLNYFHAAFATDVPDQVLNFYKAAEAAMPSYDPAVALPGLAEHRLGDLELALRAHIFSTGSQQATRQLAARLNLAAAATPSTALAENDSLIVPTIDRLDESATVLNDAGTHGAMVSVSLAGSSGGSVSGSGIACPGTCSRGFAPGAVVTLTATPAAGSSFTGWSGACSGTGTCTVTVGLLDQAVTATFGSGVSSAGGSTPATPTTPATSTTPAALVGPAGGHHTARPNCTLRPAGGKVRLINGSLLVTVRCDRAAAVTLSGTVTRVISRRRSVKTRLQPIRRSLRASVPVSLTVRLPGAVVRQLASGARESLVLMLNVGGGGQVSVKVGSLPRPAGVPGHRP